MIVELIGQPACGKTYLLKRCQEQLGSNFVFMDSDYNLKNKIGKATFLLFRTHYLFDSRYFKIKKDIKSIQTSKVHRRFYLKQFRLDFILIKTAIKLSKKGRVVVFSENLINLYKYIYFRKGEQDIKRNLRLSQKYTSLLEKDLLHRDYLIKIEVDKKDNIIQKAKRLGISPEEFSSKNDGDVDFDNVEQAMDYTIEMMRGRVTNIVIVKNDYTKNSVQQLLNIFKKIDNYEHNQ